MAKQPQVVPITKRPGQVSAPGGELTNYFLKTVPNIISPQWQTADLWRAFVNHQEIAGLCREAITTHLLSLDWTIVARDVDNQDNLKEDIKYYVKLLERGNAYYYDVDFASHVEWINKDLQDLPFGAASEIGREGDQPDGKVVWIRPLDAGTLNPTLNVDYPVIQEWPSFPPVFFPRDAISRVYLSPRTEIRREGWGMAPPERIYLAMEMLSRGDNYYAKLLLDTPQTGILDLIDFDPADAAEWIKSVADLMFGIQPLKVPVLAGHSTAAKWIPFGRLPSEIMYDSVTNRYITILTAGYGLTPSDIGFASSSNGGETLSGTIRQERRSARSGKALAKIKLSTYFNKILPDTLMFKWIDSDDEKAVAMGRARMASANAYNFFVTNKIFTPGELRRQSIADGLITVSVPETIDINSKEFPVPQISSPFGGGNRLANQTGASSKVSASGGGQGDAIPQRVLTKARSNIQTTISKAIFAGNKVLGGLINTVRSSNDVQGWEQKFDYAVIDRAETDSDTQMILDSTLAVIRGSLQSALWIPELSKIIMESLYSSEEENLKNSLRDELISRAEEEFISGAREEIALTSEEEESLNKINLSRDFPQLSLQVEKSILDTVSRVSILVAKNEILSYKFDIDTTDHTDNNTLKLARSVSAKVFELLPNILNDIYWETYKSLVSDYRSDENASN